MVFRVGLNYPWVDYGLDFGSPQFQKGKTGRVPAWRRPLKRGQATGDLDARPSDQVPEDCPLYHDLVQMHSFGVEVCRFFVLADGLCLKAPESSNSYKFERGAAWEPVLPPNFKDDFAFFTRVACAAGVKVIPVLLDYQFAVSAQVIVNGREYRIPPKVPGSPNAEQYATALTKVLGYRDPLTSPDPARWLKGGRWPLLRTAKRESTGSRSDERGEGKQTLRSLIPVLKEVIQSVEGENKRCIEAWEVMNEPDNCVDDYGGEKCSLISGEEGDGLGPGMLDDFLLDVCDVINGAGYAATIGFHSAEALAARLLQPRKKTARSTRFQQAFARQAHGKPGLVAQFHFYPEGFGWVAKRHRRSNFDEKIPAQLFAKDGECAASNLDAIFQTLTTVKLEEETRLRDVIVGEFATSNSYQEAHRQTWPGKESLDWDGAALEDRFGAIRAAVPKSFVGSILALPWSFGGGQFSEWDLRRSKACAKIARDNLRLKETKTTKLIGDLAGNNPQPGEKKPPCER